jgi:hypothetical protein
MIVLYRDPTSPRADEIQSRLEDLVVAHRVATPDQDDKSFDELPAIEEGDARYSGDAIEAFLLELDNELTTSRQVSADACYVNPDAPGHCI